MKLMARVESELSVGMPVRAVFDYPRLQDFACHLEQVRQSRLLSELEAGGDDLAQMLEQVTSMPDSEVERLMRELRKEAAL